MSRPKPRTIVIALLALLALGVVFLLPQFVPAPLIEAPVESAVENLAPGEVSPSRVAEKKRFREQAQETLAEVFALRERLQQIGVNHWSGEQYARAEALVATGDAQYGRGEYKRSLASYGEALALLQGLEGESKILLAEALSGAEQAIEAGLVDKARGHITLLNHLAPENDRVAELRARLEQLPAVAELLRQGQKQIDAGELAAAESALARAVTMDDKHVRARSLLEQVRADQRRQAFSQLMGQGYAAMEAGDFAEASAHFEAADKIAPDSDGVARALAQLENRRTRLSVDRRLARARELESRENWGEAVAVYRELIALDAALAEPRARLVPAQVRAELDERLQALIAEPLALSRPAVAERARQTLEDARSISRPGDKLNGQVQRLATLLARASEPVAVQLRSDNRTEVTLFRVGRLGTFDTTMVELKPGKYVAAGARAGYRDVRVEFTVTGETPAAPVVVRCTETI